MTFAHCVVTWVLYLSLDGCAARASTSPPTFRAAGLPETQTSGDAFPADAPRPSKTDAGIPPRAAVQLTEIPRWYRTMDPLSTYHFHPQEAPESYRPLPERIRSPYFPGREFSEIWAFEVSHGFESASDCQMLARNGTLCGNVVYPGRLLDEPQTSQLVSIARHPLDAYEVVKEPDGSGHSSRRARMRCGDEVAAMFVFYDARRRPVGVVGVDDDCAQWSLWPAPTGGWVGLAATLTEERQVLSQLCLGLDLARCAPKAEVTSNGSPRSEEALKDNTASLQRALLPLLLREWPAVDESKTLTDVTQFEREQLCAWYTRSAALAISLFEHYPRWWFSGAGFDDEQAHKMIRLEGFEDCVKRFPRGNTTVGSARTCITRHLEHFWDRNETCHIAGVWGIM